MSGGVRVRKYFNPYIFANLRTRLLLLLLLILLPALALSIYTASEQDRLASIAAQQEALRLAQLAAANQAQFIDVAEQLLTTLTRIPAVYDGNTEACNELFGILREEYRNYTNIFMVDTHGDTICSGLPMDEPLNVSSASWFIKAKQDRGFSVGEYALGRLTGRPVVTFSYPIFTLDNEIKYFVGTSLDLARISALITTVQLPPSTTLAAIDRQGSILYRYPEDEGWIGRSVATPSLVEQIVGQGTGAIEATGSDGVERLYGFSPLDSRSEVPATYVIIGISKDVAFPEGTRLLAENLIGLGLVGLLTLLAAWFGTEGVVMRHVSALVGAVDRLRAGNLSARVDTERMSASNEFGQLAFAFNDMAKALEDDRDELEARVTRRTAELKKTNSELEEQRKVAEALRDVAMTLNGTLELKVVLSRILENVGRVVPHDTANIMFIEDNFAQVMGYRGYDELGLKTISEARFPIDKTPALRDMLASGDPVLIADMADYTEPRPDNPWLRSYLGVPISLGTETIGFLNLNSVKPDFFLPEHADGLQAFAAQAAIALENARLYEQASDLAALEERQRLAHDLHDAVSQILFSSSLIAQSLPRLWEKKPEKVVTHLEQIYKLNRGAHAELRALLLELNEDRLGEAGMDELLKQLAEGAAGRYNLDVQLLVDGKPSVMPLPQKQKITFYRIAQEALNNIAKHAKARHVEVRLTFEPGRCTLRVHDDGRGFDTEQVMSTSMGLGIMRERAASIGATLNVSSVNGSGTAVDLIWAQTD